MRLAVDNDATLPPPPHDDDDDDDVEMPSKSRIESSMSVPMIASVDIWWDIVANVASCLPRADDAPSDLDVMKTCRS